MLGLADFETSIYQQPSISRLFEDGSFSFQKELVAHLYSSLEKKYCTHNISFVKEKVKGFIVNSSESKCYACEDMPKGM